MRKEFRIPPTHFLQDKCCPGHQILMREEKAGRKLALRGRSGLPSGEMPGKVFRGRTASKKGVVSSSRCRGVGLSHGKNLIFHANPIKLRVLNVNCSCIELRDRSSDAVRYKPGAGSFPDEPDRTG